MNINLEYSQVHLSPQVVTVRGGPHGSHAVLRKQGETDAQAVRRAVSGFQYRRLKAELSKLADHLDGRGPKPSEPRNNPQQWRDPWGSLRGSSGASGDALSKSFNRSQTSETRNPGSWA
ncbi:hypothetical protein N9N45_07025 [Planktomarina temperata]|nr:hypothetical protein [Planktomarina temperata]